MSLQSKEKLSWDDIKVLYNLLNQNREKFSFSGTITPPENKKKKVVPTDVENLNNYVVNMASNKYIQGAAQTGVTIPESKTLIYPLEFQKIKNTLENINKICAFDNSFYTSNNGFNPDFDAPSCSTQCNTFCPHRQDAFTGFDHNFCTRFW